MSNAILARMNKDGAFEEYTPYAVIETEQDFRYLEEAVRYKATHRWIPVSERLPETDDFVLVIVWGQYKNVRLEGAIEFANYDKDEGWILEMWPEWENPNVTYWMQVPERPEV